MATKAEEIVEKPRTYYELIYRRRHSWVGHFIPIRIKWYGLYLEGYLATPGKPDEEGKPTKAIPVKIAYLPTVCRDTEWVKDVSVIYPTARILTKFENGELIDGRIGDDLEEFMPPPLHVTKRSLDTLVRCLGNRKWTSFELASLFGRKPEDMDKIIDKSKDLLEVGDKYCLVTGKKEKAYSVGMPQPKSLVELEKQYEQCRACQLGELRAERNANLVFGRGSQNALAMVIAESPWELEERDKKPLHPDAPAGNVLYRVMNKVGLNQDEWYLTNAVICRPLLHPGGPLEKNKPTMEHMNACSLRLKETLRSISPRLVVLLGSHAYQAWFGYPPPGGVGKSAGWVSAKDGASILPTNYHVYFIHHPSYVARMSGTKGEYEVQRMYIDHWEQIAKAYKEIKDGNARTI
jgi:DNA polymerase